MAKKSVTKLKKEDKLKAKAETEVPKRRDAFILVGGLFALAVAVFTLISLISYVFTWADDQSLFMSKDMFDASVETGNEGGKWGLLWASFLVSKLFGLGAFIVPFFFFGVALYCLKIKKINLLRFSLLSLLGCVVVSLVFSFIFSFTKVDDWFGNGAGGSYGYYAIASMKNMIGGWGTGSIVGILLIVWSILVNGNLVTSFYAWIDKITAPKPEKEEEPDKVAEDAPVNLYEDLDAEVPFTF